MRPNMAGHRRTLRALLSLAIAMLVALPGDVLAASWSSCGSVHKADCCCGPVTPDAAQPCSGTTASAPSCSCEPEPSPAAPAQGSDAAQTALLLVLASTSGTVVPRWDDQAIGELVRRRDERPAASAREVRERHCVFRI
jgi:hypothetical protein